jgi:molybdate transport system regulatory protein
LRSIAAAGSIRIAAREIAMSYNRAWTLVRDMNRMFRKPLLEISRGGGDGGGAELTKMGAEVLLRYSRMERACRKATRADWKALRLLLK